VTKRKSATRQGHGSEEPSQHPPVARLTPGKIRTRRPPQEDPTVNEAAQAAEGGVLDVRELSAPDDLSTSRHDGAMGAPALVVCKPGRQPMLAETELINMICGAIAEGATEISVCRALPISMSTFSDWKARGRAGEEPYRTFYIRYQQARGERENVWSQQACRDAKWALTHHPDTKMRWAEPRVYKEGGKQMLEQMDAKKAGIGRELEKYGFDDDDDDTDDYTTDDDAGRAAEAEAGHQTEMD
jgi:hypothetical protein